MNKNFKYADLQLPVFKQGDDFQGFLNEANGNVAEAFVMLAEQYEEAAKLARRMAGIAKENPNLEADGNTHMIEVCAEKDLIDRLVKDQILMEIWEEEVDGEDEDDDFVLS